MSPFQHGEFFVLDDGGEVDLDLGNYEHSLDVTLTKDNNITPRKIYQDMQFNLKNDIEVNDSEKADSVIMSPGERLALVKAMALLEALEAKRVDTFMTALRAVAEESFMVKLSKLREDPFMLLCLD